MLGYKTKLGTSLDRVAGLPGGGQEITARGNFTLGKAGNAWADLAPFALMDPIQADETGGTLNKSAWFLLFGVALASRIVASFILPNAEEDGYSYAERIAHLTHLLATGQFRPAALFDFWLPLFPFVSAILNLWVHDPIVSGKIVNAVCGAMSCVLVFAITKRLTANVVCAVLAFLLTLFSPLHILYSAACMTDVPHCCLVLASVWFVLRRRWVSAAILAALAGSVRVEAWALIPAIPFLQLLRERRVSLGPLLILILPPLLWMGIGYWATGNPLAYFADRARYQTSYLAFYATRRDFVFSDVCRDVQYFFLGANPAIFLSAVAAAAIIFWQAVRRSSRFCWACAVPAIYGAALLAALLVAYVTKAQPVLFPRYSLIFFLLGLPLSAWLFQLLIEHFPAGWLTRSLGIAVLLTCAWQVQAQILTLSKVVEDFHAHQRVTAALVSAFEQSGDRSLCFCDDAAIRVLSREPPERFLFSAETPSEAALSPAAFESYLSHRHATYLVFVRKENSLPVKFDSQLGQSERAKTGNFEFVTVGRSSFGADIWLYRLREPGSMR